MLSNRGEALSISYGTNPANKAAVTDAARGTTVWDRAQVAAAVARGQLAWQILFHEGEHMFFDYPHNGVAPFPFPTNGIATVDVGGYTFSFDLSNTDQYSAYEHIFVHDGLVDDTGPNGSDSTFATYEGLAGAGSVTNDATHQPATLTNEQLLAMQVAEAGHSLAGSVQPGEELAQALALEGGVCAQTVAVARPVAAIGYMSNPSEWGAFVGVEPSRP